MLLHMRQRREDCDRLSFFERLSVLLIRMRASGSRRLRPLLRPGAGAVGLVAAVYAACQLLKSQSVPDAKAWEGVTGLNVLLVSSGVITLIGGFLVGWGYAHALRKSDQNVELAEACKAVWALTHRTTEIPWDRVGVHVWTVRGLKGMCHLERRATFVVEKRKTTPITWRKGKGAIGACWSRDESLILDVAKLEQLGHDRATFCALPSEARYGLSWREFRASQHYRAVLAIPLRAGPPGALRVAGSLSVDVQVNGHIDALNRLSQDRNFGAVLSVCEAVLGRTG